MNGRLVVQVDGDLEAGQALVKTIPARIQQEDAIAAYIARLWLWVGDGDKALAALQRGPNEFLEEGRNFGFTPKGILAGWAHLISGRRAAANAEWTQALAVVEKRIVAEPERADFLRWKAQLLALLARASEADTAWQLYTEMAGRNAVPLLQAAEFDVAMGRKDEAINRLQAVAATEWGPRFYAYGLRYNPWYAAIRDDPRVQALIAEGQAKLAAEPGATTGGALAPQSSERKSVAVLAFANLSDDKGNEYFSDGISEELLNVLAKVPRLKVMARTSSFHFKGKDTAIADIARQLGVAYVVEGSVRKQGDKVRITAQLIKAADGFHVWSDTFTRDLKDIFAVQDEIAGLIAQQLQLKLGESTRVTKVVNPEAYRLLLEGRQFWNLRTEDGFAKAEVAFTKALTIDPQFAEVHAGLAGVCVIRSVYRELDGIAIDANDLQRADSEGRRALEIDPSSAEAHAALGHVDYFANRLGDSDRHFQQALTLSPNSALVHCWYALLLSAQGRLDASLQHYQMAAELDPLWFINLHMLGSELALAQRFDQSLGIIERAAALRTEIFLHNTAGRASALLALGRKEDAFEAARHILRHPDVRPRWNSDAVAIRVLWEGGRQQEAEDEAARLLTRWPQDFYLRGFTLVALGRFDEALPYLTRTPSSLVRTLYWEPMWDPWREDPRFKQLIVKLGRAEEYKVARATLARMRQEQEAKK